MADEKIIFSMNGVSKILDIARQEFGAIDEDCGHG